MKMYTHLLHRWANAIVISGAVLAAGSFGCLPNDDCDAQPIAIEGSESDYTLQAGQAGSVTLHAPMACPETAGFNPKGDARLVALEATGANTFGLYGDAGCHGDAAVGCGSVSWDLFVGDVVAEVRQAHPSVQWLVPLRIGTQCEPDPPISGCRYNLRMFNVQTNDWRIMNTLVDTLRKHMAQAGLGECVGALVSEIEVGCPD